MKRLDYPPLKPEPLPYIKIHIIGWDYCEQLEKKLEYYKGQTVKEIKDKHIKQ